MEAMTADNPDLDAIAGGETAEALGVCPRVATPSSQSANFPACQHDDHRDDWEVLRR